VAEVRNTATFVMLVCFLGQRGLAQFKSTTQLVVAPVTVTDAKGHFVNGLTTGDLILTDNSVPEATQMDWMAYPIDLVVAVETGANSRAVIDKLGNSGILFTQLLAANAGETAVISFSDEAKVRQNFTSDPDAVTLSLRMLTKDGDGAHILDGLQRALTMLEARPADRRRIILIIAEQRDRGSEAKLADVMEQVQRVNAAVYWMTYSPFLQPFTAKPKTMDDLKPIAQRSKYPLCGLCPKPDDRGAPMDVGQLDPLSGLGELMHLRQPDLSKLFTEATGARALSFLKKNALEEEVQVISAELHRQYILSFEPRGGEPGTFHAIRVVVRDRPELVVKARAGYWVVR
jgi:VWFA-related protein